MDDGRIGRRRRLALLPPLVCGAVVIWALLVTSEGFSAGDGLNTFSVGVLVRSCWR